MPIPVSSHRPGRIRGPHWFHNHRSPFALWHSAPPLSSEPISPEPMRPIRPSMLAVALLPVTGCGDSLVSGPALEVLLGKQPFPDTPRWLHMWVDEGAEGVVVSCELARPTGPVDAEGRDTIMLDQVWVPPPEWAEPVAWTGESDFAWALSLHLLVDGETFSFDRAAAAFEEQDPDALPSVWGMADSVARLHGEGNMELLGETIVAGEVPPELDADGRAWVGFAQEIVVATGTFAGAVTALDPEDQQVFNDDGIPVRRLASLDNTSIALLFGQPFGGVEGAEDCLEEGDLDDEYEEHEEHEEHEEDTAASAPRIAP